MHLNSLKISHRFATLFGLVALVVALSAAWSFTVFHEFIAKGSAHERLAQGRDLVADMAVPGQHIIESYLLCLQLAGTANVAQREEMVERLLILQREYDARYAWWASLPLPDALGSAHLAQARTPTVAFYRTAFNDFVPALRHGDEKTAGQSLERLKALYETHRIAAGRVEQIARKHNESLSADFEVRIRWTAMFLSLALLACLAAGLKGVAMIRDSIAPLLADAARLATTIASGDIRARWLHNAKHDFGELGTALNKMAETLEGRAEALKNNAAEMERRATHDHLTGFPNRGLLEERLYHSMRQAQRQKRRLMVLSIDLDNLKLVNDSLGHNTGDELLSHVAHRMAACIRGADTIARLGGDEFVILFFLEDSASDDSIIPMLHRLLDAIAKPWQLGGYEIRVSCSIGVARYPGDGEDVQTLLRNADAAMYRAKELGRNNFQFYTKKACARRSAARSCCCCTSRRSTRSRGTLSGLKRCCAGSPRVSA
jgi:diguanylate cyclase (GGDEF)-like protein